MVLDTSELWRRALALAPRWARTAMVTSAIVGEVFHTLIKAFAGGEPPLFPRLSGFLTLSVWDWPLMGLGLTMPVAGAWHFGRRYLRGPSKLESAEEYVGVLKLIAANAGYTKLQEKVFWNSAMEKLSSRFMIGTSLPDPTALAGEVQTDTIARD